jgi:PAS domain S-box-containing protein
MKFPTDNDADRTRIVIDTIPTMAWTVTPDGTVDFANRRWREYAGADQLANPNGIVHPADLPEVLENWDRHKEKSVPYDHEMRLRKADGTYRWFLVRTAPLLDSHGRVVRWYGISIDIEERKRAQDELRLAYQRLSYQVENTPLGVIEWDRNMFIRRWSDRAEEIFGWSAQEVIGLNIDDPSFSIIYEGDREAITAIGNKLTKGLVDRNISRNRNLTKDGKLIYCEWYNSVLKDDHGEVLTILSLVQDVTRQETSNIKLRESFREIRRLNEHLQMVREEERTHIAREIHDELGGQLTVLKMDASWLNQQLAGENKAVRARLKNIIQILNSMVRSVRRISSQLRPSQLDNLGLVAAMEWHVKEFRKRSRLTLVFNGPGKELQLAETVKNGLFRIFQEALTNVARHSSARHVTIDLTEKKGKLVLIIADDGKGLDYEKVRKGGTLGILGMKERAITLGGKYDMWSEPGKGTMITVTLPVGGKIKPV